MQSIRTQMKGISENYNDAKGPTDEMRRAGDLASARASQKTRDEITKQGAEAGLKNPLKAKFKIEVTFGPKRTIPGPNLLGIQIWESGKRLNGGGDDLSFWCQNLKAKEGCWGVITSDNIRGGIAVCPHCQKMVNANLLTNMKIGRVTTQNLSKLLEHTFRSLGHSADIYLKYDQTDIRVLAMERQKGRNVARRLKGMHIYPLKHIIKETANGASLRDRFFAFLCS